MTNLEKIQSMNAEELAKTISNELIDCNACPIQEFCQRVGEIECSKVWKQWLGKEVDEE